MPASCGQLAPFSQYEIAPGLHRSAPLLHQAPSALSSWWCCYRRRRRHIVACLSLLGRKLYPIGRRSLATAPPTPHPQEEYDLNQKIDTGKLIDAAGAGRSMFSPGWLTQLNQLWGGKSVRAAAPHLAALHLRKAVAWPAAAPAPFLLP